MSDKLENIDRLAAALAKLDGVVTAQTSVGNLTELIVERDSLLVEVAELKKHNSELTSALKHMQDRHNNLNEAGQLVSDRLDGAISDIKALLEA